MRRRRTQCAPLLACAILVGVAAVEEINAGMQEMSASTDELARIARELQDETARFQTGAEDALDAPRVAPPAAPVPAAFAAAA